MALIESRELFELWLRARARLDDGEALQHDGQGRNRGDRELRRCGLLLRGARATLGWIAAHQHPVWIAVTLVRGPGVAARELLPDVLARVTHSVDEAVPGKQPRIEQLREL